MPNRKGPGPADYMMKTLVGFNNHDFNSKKPRGPQYSMSPRNPIELENKSPGPATVDIKKLTRVGTPSNQTISMRQKTKDLKFDMNPGPTHDAVDTGIYKSRLQPKYSISTRTKPLQLDSGPAPNYEPTSVNVFKNRAPAFPMFSRTKGIGLDNTPPPRGAEVKSKFVNQAPNYSHRWRYKDITGDQNPGPAAYNLSNYNPFATANPQTIQRKYAENPEVLVLPVDKC